MQQAEPDTALPPGRDLAVIAGREAAHRQGRAGAVLLAMAGLVYISLGALWLLPGAAILRRARDSWRAAARHQRTPQHTWT